MDMDFTRLKESDEYRQQREELRIAELDLIDHVERVAELRRSCLLTLSSTITNWSTLRAVNPSGFPGCSAAGSSPDP